MPSDELPRSDELRKRLRRVGLARRSPTATMAATTPPPHAYPGGEDPVPIEAVAPGRIVHTQAGSCYLIETRYSLHEQHGPSALGELLHCSPHIAAQLAQLETPQEVALDRLVFLDTETTGLAGGAGTLAFLVGAGVMIGDEFHLRQYFLRDPAEEFAMIDALAALLADHAGLVTFNGRAFDVPLLESRFLLARCYFDLRELAHLDLLPPARRLWRGRLPDCSLNTLEQAVLGVKRTQVDVPGWMIPQLYVGYLHTGDARELQRVIYHNTIDILSMVTLATYLMQAFGDPIAEERTGADCLRLAMWLEASHELEQAERTYRTALARALAPDHRATALKRFGAFLKRADRRPDAIPLWAQLTDLVPDDHHPYVELAKYYEWHARELPSAINWTKRALAEVERWPPTWQREDVSAELQHRLARLERKFAAR